MNDSNEAHNRMDLSGCEDKNFLDLNKSNQLECDHSRPKNKQPSQLNFCRKLLLLALSRLRKFLSFFLHERTHHSSRPQDWNLPRLTPTGLRSSKGRLTLF